MWTRISLVVSLLIHIVHEFQAQIVSIHVSRYRRASPPANYLIYLDRKRQAFQFRNPFIEDAETDELDHSMIHSIVCTIVVFPFFSVGVITTGEGRHRPARAWSYCNRYADYEIVRERRRRRNNDFYSSYDHSTDVAMPMWEQPSVSQ